MSPMLGRTTSSDNTAYDWCFNTDMERYLNDRGIINAPRPPDTWCNMFIDECILKYEDNIESVQEIAVPGSESAQNLIESYEEIIQDLEDKKAAQEQGSTEEQPTEDEEEEDN